MVPKQPNDGKAEPDDDLQEFLEEVERMKALTPGPRVEPVTHWQATMRLLRAMGLTN